MKTLSLLLLLAVQGGIAQNKPSQMDFCEKSFASARKWAIDGTITRLTSYDKNCKKGQRGYHWVDDPNHVVLEPAKPSNVSSDTPKWKIWPPVNWDGASRPPWEKPAPQPLVEKAVESTTVDEKNTPGYCAYYEAHPGKKNTGLFCIGSQPKSYTCNSHPNFHVFLLPDESTGEKYCLNIPKEK